MSDFKRERRYLVFKESDTDLCQDCIGIRHDLMRVGSEIEACRKAGGKPPLECVVVESDWPEYEIVWGMIKDRVNGDPNSIDKLNARVEELEEEKASILRAVAHNLDDPDFELDFLVKPQEPSR